MKEIAYAGGSFVTSDEIAEALFKYAAALGIADRAATVDVPAFGIPAPGVTVLVGPASQLMAEPVDESGAPPAGDAFIDDVHDRITRLEQTFSHPHDQAGTEWDI